MGDQTEQPEVIKSGKSKGLSLNTVPFPEETLKDEALRNGKSKGLSLNTVPDEITEDKHVVRQNRIRKNLLTQEEANFWFTYDWKEGKLKHRWAHYLRKDTVGYLRDGKSYLFTLLGKNYSLAHTIYTIFFGSVPSDFLVDFKDKDPLNTRIENLYLRHYSFIIRSKHDSRYESLTGVSLKDGSWQARFKGHSSFGNVTQQGPLRHTAKAAREDYVKFKTEYMRGLFVWPVWNASEQIYLDSEKYLDEDMVDYFNRLPIRSYQIIYAYKDPYLSNQILPDRYSLDLAISKGNMSHPLIDKYFKKHERVFKLRIKHLTKKEKETLYALLERTQIASNIETDRERNMHFSKALGLLSYYKAAKLTRGWSKEELALVDHAVGVTSCYGL